MGSADLYSAVAAFLPGDIVATVNAETPGLLKAKSVYVARAARGRTARRTNALPLVVELVNLTPRPGRKIGPDEEVRDSLWEFVIVSRKKAPSDGAGQLTAPQKILRALLRRYHDVSALTIPVSGGLATFVSSLAEGLEPDHDPETAELELARMKVTFTFREALAET